MENDKSFFRRLVVQFYGGIADGPRKPRRTHEEMVQDENRRKRAIAARREFNAGKKAERDARRHIREAEANAKRTK